MQLCGQLEEQEAQSSDAHLTLINTLLNGVSEVGLCGEKSSWDSIFQHFDLLFTNEQAIDKLKKTIVRLAVSGVVSPEISDARVSLNVRGQAMSAESAIDVAVGAQQPRPKAKSRANLSAASEDWRHARLGEVVALISGQHLGPQEYFRDRLPGTIPYLTGPAEFGELFPTPTRFTNERRAVAEPGDILLTCKGSGVGKTNIADAQIAISRQLMAVRPIGFLTDYAKLVMDSIEEALRLRIIGIAIPGISRDDVLDAVVLVPPLEEQRRIVAKVVQLITLCDALKTRIRGAQLSQVQLADAVVRRAIAS